MINITSQQILLALHLKYTEHQTTSYHYHHHNVPRQSTFISHLDYHNCLKFISLVLPLALQHPFSRQQPKRPFKNINYINSLLCSKPSNGFLFHSK